jgi:hypothetical protein
MRWFSTLTAALAALLIGAAPASSQGTVDGTVQYGSEIVPMSHVYARETRPSATDDSGPQTVILITDRIAPAEVAASRSAYYTAARLGQLRGLLLSFEPPREGARLAILAPGGGADDTSVPDVFDRIELTDLIREGGWVSGHLRTREPVRFTGGETEEPATYTIDLRFRVPVAPAPQPTETLTGEAARSSAQAAAAVRSLNLIRTGTPAEVQASLYPDHPAWDGLGSEQSAAILAAMRERLPAPDAFRASIQRVIVYGDEAVVVAHDADGARTVSLRREGG